MPKLSMGGKVKHYAYTPEGKAQYERDKARLKMSPGMLINPDEPLPAPVPKGTGWNKNEAGLPYVYKNPKAAKKKRPAPKVDQSKRRKPTPVQSKKQSMGGPSWGEFPKPSK